jgi:membrane-bound lytic murein transglycosylase D
VNKGVFINCSRYLSTAIFYFILFSGCSLIHKQDSLLDLQDTPPNAELYSDALNPVALQCDTTVFPEDSVQLLLARAGALCEDTYYAAADSIYRSLLQQLNSGSSDSITDEYINEIVTVYSTIMPDTFIAPDEIAEQVFQQQMFQALDSLPYNAKDSTIVSRLINHSTLSYDIPIVWNKRVEKSLFYYITRNQGTIEYWKKRASIYLSFMKKMLADNSLPMDLAYLPLIESGFNPKAYSRSHASGIWQFIPSTGKLYGLRTNYWIDERRDPVRSTKAAIQYFKKLYGDFNNWHLALAAYNCGEGTLSRAIERCGTSDYWQLRLPLETMNYLPLYLAALTIAKDPAFAAIAEAKSDTIPFDTTTVNDCIDIREIAAGIGVPFDTLKMMNPHIIHWCTPPDMTNILLYLPSGTAPLFKTFYTSLPAEKKVKWYRYQVQSGDNLGSIARHFKLPVDGIKSINKLHASRIIAGHYLFIPIPVGNTAYVTPACDDQPAIKKTKTTVRWTEVPAGATLVVYEVKTGDTIWKLSELFGVSAKQIRGWNNIGAAKIKAGQILSIYTKDRVNAAVQAQPNTLSNQSFATMSYIVRQGDNPFRIAQMFEMSTDELYTLNGINPTTPIIHRGDTLYVKKRATSGNLESSQQIKNSIAEPVVEYVVSKGDNLYQIAQNFSTSVAAIKAANRLSETSILHAGDTINIPATATGPAISQNRSYPEKTVAIYTVKNGDNLWRIANSFGIPVKNLCEYNGLQANSVLMPGDTIRFFKRDDL